MAASLSASAAKTARTAAPSRRARARSRGYDFRCSYFCFGDNPHAAASDRPTPLDGGMHSARGTCIHRQWRAAPVLPWPRLYATRATASGCTLGRCAALMLHIALGTTPPNSSERPGTWVTKQTGHIGNTFGYVKQRRERIWARSEQFRASVDADSIRTRSAAGRNDCRSIASWNNQP